MANMANMDYLSLANAISHRKVKIKTHLAESDYRFFDGSEHTRDLIDAFHGEIHFHAEPSTVKALNEAWQHVISEDQTHFIGHNKKQPKALQQSAVDVLFERLVSPDVDGLTGISLTTEDTVVVPYSSTQLLISALQARPKKHLNRVLCAGGFYKGSAKLAAAAGLSINAFPIDLSRDGAIAPQVLENYLSQHHQETALLWLTMPGNPLVGHHSVEQLEAIGKIILRYDLDVLIDMAFDKLLPKGSYPTLPNIRVQDETGQSHSLYERVFAITGNSKGLSATGPWKLGAGVCGNPQWLRETLNLVTAVTFQRESTHLIHAGLKHVCENYLQQNREELRRIQQHAKRRVREINETLGDEILLSYGDPVYTPFHCLSLCDKYLRRAGIEGSCQLAEFLLVGAGIESVELDLVGIHQPGVRLNVTSARINGHKSPENVDLIFDRLSILMRDVQRGLTYDDVLARIAVTDKFVQ